MLPLRSLSEEKWIENKVVNRNDDNENTKLNERRKRKRATGNDNDPIGILFSIISSENSDDCN